MSVERDDHTGTLSSSSSAPAAPTAPAQASRQIVQLRGLSFDEQVATLTPRAAGAAAPVQMKEPEAEAEGDVRRLAKIAMSLFRQLAEGFGAHFHYSFEGAPFAPPMFPFVSPRIVSGGEYNIGMLAGALRNEFNQLARDWSFHLHQDAEGVPSSPPMGLMPSRMGGAETDLAFLARDFESDVNSATEWFSLHTHISTAKLPAPTGLAFPPLLLDQGELSDFIRELEEKRASDAGSQG